jgi:lipopolysaccharide/colanic/teichoic acid biosynthesis glycosyltransferase
MNFILSRTLNVVFAVLLLIITAPIFLLGALTVFLDSGFPIFFCQKRIGCNGEPFTLLKLRTMKKVPLNDGDRGENLLEQTSKITRVMRAFSIDELPQLINVIKGDMNIVGPRPLLPEYEEIYTAEQSRRHQVKPGITGWAQINGRNSLEWDEKLSMDIWYVDNRSFLIDLRIILATPFAMFFKGGINSSKCETMPKLTRKRRSNC